MFFETNVNVVTSMKKWFVLTAIYGLFFSCSNTHPYRENIEGLSRQWDVNNQQMETIDQQLHAQVEQLMQLQQTVSLPDTIFANPLQQRTLDSVQQQLRSLLSSLGSQQQEMDNFRIGWRTKSIIVKELSDSLEKGNFDGDIEANLSNLQETLQLSSSLLNSWSANIDRNNRAADTLRQSISQLMQALPQ